MSATEDTIHSTFRAIMKIQSSDHGAVSGFCGETDRLPSHAVGFFRGTKTAFRCAKGNFEVNVNFQLRTNSDQEFAPDFCLALKAKGLKQIRCRDVELRGFSSLGVSTRSIWLWLSKPVASHFGWGR